MKPYYDHAGITIYHGDCMEILSTITTVDIVISSPPYNQIPKTNASGMLIESRRKINDGYASHSDDMPEDQYQDWMRCVFGRCREITRGLVWINHKTRFRSREGIHPLQVFPWSFYSEVVWDRGGSLTLNARKFAPSHEFIYAFGQPHFWDNTLNTTMTVWRINPERGIPDHPCPFPLEIAIRCIAASCPQNGIVLDPFSGSGTALLAAQSLGRKAIGIEIEERYCEIAAKRLAQEVFDFGPPEPQLQQAALLSTD